MFVTKLLNISNHVKIKPHYLITFYKNTFTYKSLLIKMKDVQLPIQYYYSSMDKIIKLWCEEKKQFLEINHQVYSTKRHQDLSFSTEKWGILGA